MNKHKKIIIIQVIFLVVVFIVIYFSYPKTNINIDGTFVKFGSINANVVMLSENPDFSNPRYLDFEEVNNISFNLKPGIYYWKSYNKIINSIKRKFVIESEVGMKIENNELENIGNVKINITKNEGGIMMGYIILEPDEKEEVVDAGEYFGRQEE